jgi:hypothetical protein
VNYQKNNMNTNKQFTFDGIYAPLPVRWVNSLARKSKPVFDRLVSLKKENLLETAGRKTSLTDWGDSWFQEALTVLLDSVYQEGKLTFFGRFTLRQFLIENLCSRLRLIEVLKRFPEIQHQKIQKPIFITGWYRTGTTHLHNLFASHPEVRVPFFWELRHPCPTLDPRSADPRRQIHKVRLAGKIHRYLAPGFSAVHPLNAENPEECLHLFDKACAGTTPFFISEAKSFAWWLLSQDFQNAYDFFKIQFQLLNSLRPGRQWVLKWPYHLWHLETLFNTFPDATIIHLHRDPCKAIPSVCSLAALARSSFCESVDNAALGKFWLDYYETGLARGFKARERINGRQIIDIRYSDLKLNPLSVIKRIQNTIQIGGSQAWTESLQKCSNAAQQKVPGRHHYAPAQFGLDTDQIRERFSRYIENYDLSKLGL